MTIIDLEYRYRGFNIGFVESLHGYLPAWKSSLEFNQWTVGHLAMSTVAEIPSVAEECIDFNYRVEAVESFLERKITANELDEYL